MMIHLNLSRNQVCQLKKVLLSLIYILINSIYIHGQNYEYEINSSDSITTFNHYDQAVEFDFLDMQKDAKQYIFDVPNSIPRRVDVFNIKTLNIPSSLPPFIITDKSPLHQGEYSVYGPIHKFKNHTAIIGSGGQNNLIGLGTVNYANASYAFSITNRLIIGTHLSPMTFRGPRISVNTLETGINLSYLINDKLAFHAFGNYTFGKSYYAVDGMYNQTNFGGYFTLDITERFGMGIGAKRYYDAAVGRWYTDPIVMPYFKINQKATINVDVGGLIMHVIRQAVYNKREENNGTGRFNGTIMPTKQPIPIR